jgi:MFS family permease
MENVAFFFHILGVMLFVAGIVVAGAAFEAARRRQRPSEIALLLGLTRVGVVLVAVGTVLAGLFGLWLVHLGKWGYGTGWVDASIVLFLVVIGLGGVGGRRPKEARLLASRLAEQDVSSDGEVRPLLDDWVSRAENYGSLLLLLVIIALMVFKP